jgi:hypothetical protein
VRQCLDVGEVVDRHNLDVGAACGALHVDCTEEVSAYPAEAVHAHPDHHDDFPLRLYFGDASRALSSLTAGWGRAAED